MADVFISYRNLPERRSIAKRLALVLRAYEISVWWDFGLEAGKSFENQILAELRSARLVMPLWCSESVKSEWVLREAKIGEGRLFPVRLQYASPPLPFREIQAADLIDWDGSITSTRAQSLVSAVMARLGKSALPPFDMVEELNRLPALHPLPSLRPSPAQPTATKDIQVLEELFAKFADSPKVVARPYLSEKIIQLVRPICAIPSDEVVCLFINYSLLEADPQRCLVISDRAVYHSPGNIPFARKWRVGFDELRGAKFSVDEGSSSFRVNGRKYDIWGSASYKPFKLLTSLFSLIQQRNP